MAVQLSLKLSGQELQMWLLTVSAHSEILGSSQNNMSLPDDMADSSKLRFGYPSVSESVLYASV